MANNVSGTRASGIVLLIVAAAYGLRAQSFELTTMTDPIGPRAFPFMLAGLTALLSIYLIVYPDEEGESWPGLTAWGRIVCTVIILLAYAYLLVPLGFVIATGLVVFLCALLFGGPPVRSALSALAFSVATYLLFVHALGLSLPDGWILR